MQDSVKKILERLKIIEDHRHIDFFRKGDYSEFVALVGSRAVGGDSPRSDYDYIIFGPGQIREKVTDVLKEMSIHYRESNYFAGVTFVDGRDKINFIFLPPGEDILWVKATKVIQAMTEIDPYAKEMVQTKEGRIFLLQEMISKLRACKLIAEPRLRAAEKSRIIDEDLV